MRGNFSGLLAQAQKMQKNVERAQAELANIIEIALRFIDDETLMPKIAQGEQGSTPTNTVGGLSILMNAANVVFRRIIKNFDDDMTVPNIRRLYDWNMQYSEKAEIKGDSKVRALGISALVELEGQAQKLQQQMTEMQAALDAREFEASAGGGMVSVNPHLYQKMSFDPAKDLVPVAAAARVLVYLVVRPDLPPKNVQEFTAYLKARPGKLSYGSPGVGSSGRLGHGAGGTTPRSSPTTP